jgi:signal transduction histidine kinase
VYLEARDNGKGMTADLGRDKDHFKPGDGSGLTAMKGLVALLEGRLEIDSAPGRGTLIRIRLLLPATS